tara:strand:- start:37 stop:627 length:591 start_codon:yes stop_codon:yes gene_type:complete
MKILLVSDTESRYIWDHFNKEKFKDIELVISCGDLKASYLQFLVTMLAVPVYYIHGNHDEGYVHNPPLGCDSIDDDLIEFKGLRILGLGGSPEYRGGRFQFSEKEMQKRYKRLAKKLKKAGGIDLLVTHSPAYQLGDGEDFAHVGFKTLRNILDDWTPKYHFHGHQHLNYGQKNERSIQYGPTLIVNAHDYHIIEI